PHDDGWFLPRTVRRNVCVPFGSPDLRNSVCCQPPPVARNASTVWLAPSIETVACPLHPSAMPIQAMPVPVNVTVMDDPAVELATYRPPLARESFPDPQAAGA